jgi:hypothetical protein
MVALNRSEEVFRLVPVEFARQPDLEFLVRVRQDRVRREKGIEQVPLVQPGQPAWVRRLGGEGTAQGGIVQGPDQEIGVLAGGRRGAAANSRTRCAFPKSPRPIRPTHFSIPSVRAWCSFGPSVGG